MINLIQEADIFKAKGGYPLDSETGIKDISSQRIRGTTVLSVRKDGQGVMAADGQVTMENTIMKRQAKKLRFMYNDQVLVGFAGATADAFSLFEKLEGKLEKYNGNLPRAAVELAKDWRTDKILRRLEALLLAMDSKHTLILSGNGDVIEPDEEVAAIGSGGPYALAAARALLVYSSLDANSIALESMKIAASICIYTNEEFDIKF
ncbi:MAG TPA: ATP-dependent protease subunit HslV, partial [Desulfatiglandales bacterium]|nr:ATP-dependent protease subunit HslV [Desulfatiglandales bacterium]